MSRLFLVGSRMFHFGLSFVSYFVSLVVDEDEGEGEGEGKGVVG